MKKYRFNNRDLDGLVNLCKKYYCIRSDCHEISIHGLHHPGTYRRRDESAIERAILESVSIIVRFVDPIKKKIALFYREFCKQGDGKVIICE